MAGKREKPEKFVSILRQFKVLQGLGMTIAKVVRQIGMRQQIYCRWRKLYDSMGCDSPLCSRLPPFRRGRYRQVGSP